jgi:putative ABC transport system permease protein
MKETFPERRPFAWLETTAQDLRYAARTLRKSPGFTVTAVTVLALAIGTNTALFSVLNAVLLRPLPYRSPEQLAVLWTEDPTQNLREGRSALWDVEQWRSQSQSFADFATFDTVSRTLMGADGAEQIAGVSISPNLLSLLGIHPVRGRSVSPEEAEQGQRLVLISHGFWHARFGGSEDALGATIVLDGLPSRIIGILPAGFQVERLDRDVWETHATHQSVRGSDAWFVLGRLRPAVTFEQAQAEMSAIARRLSDQLPAADRNRSIGVAPLSLYMVGSQSRVAMWMLGGAVFLVFLIAAANITSLSLARSVARAREMMVRAALGASGARIVRQLLTESVLLAAISGLMGTLVALVGIPLIRAFGPGNLPRLNEVSLDPRVLGWALGISLLAGILVGLAPAMTALRRDVRPSAEDGSRSVSGGAATRRIHRSLVVAEFALAVVLLVGAGLLVRSWWYVTNIDPAFRPERVLMMELSTPTTLHAANAGEATRVSAQRIDLYHRVLDQVRTVPGVESAGIIGGLFIGNTREHVLTIEGDDGTVSERLQIARAEVSADFFTTLATPLLRGRFFSNGDGRDAARVAIVNDAMARRAWPRGASVGRRFKFGPRDSDQPWYTVVGVVADMRRQGQERNPVPQIFESLAQNPPQRADVLIRTSSDSPQAIAGTLRAAVHRVETNAPIYGLVPLEQQLGSYLAHRRFQTSLLTGFSIVALLLAVIGVYGVMSYSVTQRTQEIGIRLALGAGPGDVLGLVVKEGLGLALAGMGIGLAASVGLTRLLANLLYGVGTTDPVTFAGVSLLLAVASLAACYVPASRAAALDAAIVLRGDRETVWSTLPRRMRSIKERVSEVVYRGFTQEDRRKRHMLAEFGKAARAVATTGELFERVAGTLRQILGVEHASIFVLDEESGDFLLTASSPEKAIDPRLPLSGDAFVVRRLKRLTSPLTVGDADFEAWEAALASSAPTIIERRRSEIHALRATYAAVLLPIAIRDELVGILVLGERSGDVGELTGRGLPTEDRDLLMTIAGQMAFLIENARLAERLAEQERVKYELALAAQVQRRLFPHTPPDIPSIELAAFCQPAREVGGDYYDFVALDAGRIGIALADVAGKGISAALLMSIVQASVRSLAPLTTGRPAELVLKLNQLLYRSTGPSSYATMFYADFDAENRRLTYVNAGHNPPYLLRAGTSDLTALTTGGTIIGMFDECDYEWETIELASGDLLVAATDGLTDALNANQEEFGEARLKALLAEAADMPCERAKEHIVEQVRHWMAGASQHDDLTFIVLRVR